MDIFRYRWINLEQTDTDAPAKPAGADALAKFFHCRQATDLAAAALWPDARSRHNR